jgi:hypothetical protein
MNYLTELQRQDNIALAEAVNTAQQLVQRYLPVLQNVIQIRARVPVHDDEPKFRGAVAHQTSVPQLYAALNHLHEQISALETELSKLNLSDIDHKKLEQALAERLLTELNNAAQKCELVYAGKSASFAMIVHDLQLLSQILREKFSHQYTQSAQNNADNSVIIDDLAATPEVILDDDEKLAYVRIVHRDMATLNEGKNNVSWIRPLLDSVKSAEKHGFAVYEHEADVMRSLKGETYGYVTLKVKGAQDITHQRPAKVDAAIGCRLLTLDKVDLNQMIKLTHQSVEYWIKDGMLHKIHRG